MQVIAVSGVDGSGKSTFIGVLQRALRERAETKRVGVVWLRFDPRASSYGHTARTPDAVSTLDPRHRGALAKRWLRAVGLARAWVWLTTALYTRQLRHQLGAVRETDILICDRFVIDYIADLMAARLLPENDAHKVRDRLPRADFEMILTAPIDVLLQRKHSAEDQHRLIRNAGIYENLAVRLGIPLIDTRDQHAAAQLIEAVLATGSAHD